MIQVSHVPAWRTHGQIHFAFLSIKSTDIFMPLPLSLPVVYQHAHESLHLAMVCYSLYYNVYNII